VPPASIPDYLALVGDDADGYPGLPGWGAKSTAAVLAKYGRLESIPADWREWHVTTRPTRARCRRRWRASGIARFSSAPSPRFAPTSLCSNQSTSCGGSGLRPLLHG